MSAKHRIIIDTDPGIDDVLAMLLAFSARPEDLEVLMISVTFGNVDAQNCLRNVVSLFHQIELEMQWRKRNGRKEGFEGLKNWKPLVAVGAQGPLADHQLMADYFHGTDGLGGIHTSHPHLSPMESWNSLFSPSLSTSDATSLPSVEAIQIAIPLFEPSNKPAHEEILRILRENEPATITIIALGPSTNLANAAAADPETFLRVKEVVLMGGAIEEAGNMTPVAEFNVFADSVAAARLLALTSPNPRSTMPPIHSASKPDLPEYPARLSRQLRLIMVPLDITVPHHLYKSDFTNFITPYLESGSPLAEWVSAFLSATFAKLSVLYSAEGTKAKAADDSQDKPSKGVGLSLHDPLCIWYLLAQLTQSPLTITSAAEDIRIETTGQWTRGACIVDRRNRLKAEPASGLAATSSATTAATPDPDIQSLLGTPDEVPGDSGNWLRADMGNRVYRCVGSEWKHRFGLEMLRRVFN